MAVALAILAVSPMLAHGAGDLPLEHPGTIRHVSAYDGKVEHKLIEGMPERHVFVYFKNSLEVRDREAADEVVPIVEVEMISMNANGQFVPPQEAVRVDIYEFGPERRLLRTTHMMRHCPDGPQFC